MQEYRCYRVWYDNGSAVLVDAPSEEQAKEQAKEQALEQAQCDGYPGLGVKRVDCLSK